MSSNIISVDLSNTDNWIVDDSTNEELSPNYQQKRREPKIGWTINTMPTPEGIKSTSLFFRDSFFTHRSSLPTNLLYTLDNFLDTIGNLTYSSVEFFPPIDPLLGNGFALKLQYNNNLLTIVSRSSGAGELTLSKGITVFQNRSLVLFDNAMTFSNVIEAGDITTRGVFEVTITASDITVTKYALTGITIDFKTQYGFTSSGNYLIFWTLDTIFWSDPNDFTEFTIGGASLAGSQKITEAKGTIITIVAYPNGFVIYCTDNIINATYSGDATNPWIFTELSNSSSLIVADGLPLVTSDESSDIQFAYTSEGLVQVTSESTQTLSNKINQFLGTSYVETKEVGESTIVHKALTTLSTRESKVKKLQLLGDRLFIITGTPEDVVGTYDDGRLYVLDLLSGKLTIQQGEFLDVTEELNTVTISDLNILKNKAYHRTGSYLVVREAETTPEAFNSRFLLLDYTTRTEARLADRKSVV